jgi:O-antigen/teichoic acid export membrane protein
MNAAKDAMEETGTAQPGPRRFRIPSVWLIAGGGWLGRGIQVLAQLAAVRILMQDLGTAGYGVFAVLASINAWLLLGDLCLGISIQNHISERRAAEVDADDVILTGAALSLAVTGTLLLVLLALGPWLSSVLLGEFKFLTPSDRLFAFYALAFPAVGTALGGVAYKIWFAWHRGYLSNLVPAAGTVIGTLAIWLVHYGQGGSAVASATLLYYAPLAILPMIALGAIVVRAGRKHRFRPDLVRPLMSRAFRFWVSGLLAAAVLQVDYIIMVYLLPVQDIVIYNIAQKLFLLVFFVYNALLFALWPVCAEAIARGDWPGVMAMVRKYIVFGMAFSLAAGIGIALFNPWIVPILAPGLDATIPLIVIGLLTFYTMMRVWTDTYAMILQSMNDLLLMWLVAPIQSVLSIGLQILFARWFGLPGVVMGLIGCFLLTAVWVLPLRCHMHARRAAAAQGSKG